MPGETGIETPRKIEEMPRKGIVLCETLDRCPFLRLIGQKGDHRTYKNTETGEIITALNTRRDLKDTHPKVFYKTQKLLASWGIVRRR